MKDNPIAIAWELSNPLVPYAAYRRVILIGEYVIIGEMSLTHDVQQMEYHVSVSLSEEAARVEAVRCTEVAEKQGFEMYRQPVWITLQHTADQMVDYLTLKGGLADKRGIMSAIFDLVRVSGKMVDG